MGEAHREGTASHNLVFFPFYTVVQRKKVRFTGFLCFLSPTPNSLPHKHQSALSMSLSVLPFFFFFWFCFSDLTHNWKKHSISFCRASFTKHIVTETHPYCCQWQGFLLLMVEPYPTEYIDHILFLLSSIDRHWFHHTDGLSVSWLL